VLEEQVAQQLQVPRLIIHHQDLAGFRGWGL
jgi:hypothetical protein